MMKVIDYVRWMGIAAWTGGLAIPRHSRGLALKPGSSARHISIESAGGCARTLETIEREYTHIQWLLGGSPLDETALDYVYQQDLRITAGALMNRAFAVVDFGDTPRDYSPEASVAVAREVSQPQLVQHYQDTSLLGTWLNHWGCSLWLCGSTSLVPLSRNSPATTCTVGVKGAVRPVVATMLVARWPLGGLPTALLVILIAN